MNKWLLTIFACVLWTVDGQQELQKEGSFTAQQHSAHPSAISKGKGDNHERGKRMPDAKKSEDESFGYSWNVGNGVSYMKMHVGKNNNPVGTDSFAAVQHKVTNALRDGGHGHLQSENDKTSYGNIHKDFLKTSQKIMSQNNIKFGAKPAILNQETLGMGNHEDKNFASFAFNTEQNKGIKDADAEFHDINSQLKQEYAKFNKDFQFSVWPQPDAHHFKELNVAHNLKSLQSKGNGDYKIGESLGGTEGKPIEGFAYDKGFLQSLKNYQNIALGGNLDGVYKSIELPLHQSHFGGSNVFTNNKEANNQGFESGENTFKEVGEEKRELQETNPLQGDEQKHSSDVSEALLKYTGEKNYKHEVEEGQMISNTFSENQGKAWSTQNVVSNHQLEAGQTENKEDSEKTTDEEQVRNAVPEISYTRQIETENQFNHGSHGAEQVYPHITNGFGNFLFSGMNSAMNQQLISDQVERIKQVQQKVIDSHFPGAGIYGFLDGQAQLGLAGYPMAIQENAGSWKQDDYDKHNNNQQIMNSNYNKEIFVPNVGAGESSYNNVRLGHSIGGPTRPFINNNAPSPKFIQGQFYGGQKLTSDENTSGGESHVGNNGGSLWRPQRYSIKSKNQQHIDLQNDTYESEKLKNEDFLKGSDERKGREIKYEGVDNLDHKETQAVEENIKHEHLFGSEEQEEVKTVHGGKVYSQFHKFSYQEPQVKVITKAVPVHKELKIPVPQMVRHPILIPVPIKVLEPYPIKIPVPVTVEKTVEVPVEKVIHYTVEKPVPMKVVKEVRVPVPKPYPVKVPVYKIKYVHHNKKKHE